MTFMISTIHEIDFRNIQHRFFFLDDIQIIDVGYGVNWMFC